MFYTDLDFEFKQIFVHHYIAMCVLVVSSYSITSTYMHTYILATYIYSHNNTDILRIVTCCAGTTALH